ncbi:MAG: SUMF1/EgtB/PvdO family nonheme iron enzyme [Candidatus Aminicenantes bacterium]|nr:SUMF1/EgtB/PvdO family nonheme iron enzyme [Candidatus Aminicenantes bacterium]
MPSDKPVFIDSDSAKSAKEKEDIAQVRFGFKEYAKTLAGVIANKKNKTPLVIGIYGPWGSGKTTLMETIINTLNTEQFKNTALYRKCKPVRFQAWKYKNEDEILAALIEEIFRTMQQDNFFKKRMAKIDELIQRFNLGKALGRFTELATGIDVSEFFSDSLYRDKLGFYDTFRKFFERLLGIYLNWWFKIGKSEKTDDEKAALVLFIDDLDRCPPERIKAVLETIKLFLDHEGCVFVIGSAEGIIQNALEGQYREGASKFMEKIVQIKFRLPDIPDEEFPDFMEDIDAEVREKIEPYLPLFLKAMEKNPRRVKQFINNLNLQRGLHQDRNTGVDFEPIFFVNILDFVDNDLKNDIVENNQTFFTLKEEIDKLKNIMKNKPDWTIPQDELDKIPESLRKYVTQKDLKDLIDNINITAKELGSALSYKAAVTGPVDKETEEKGERIAFKRETRISPEENMVEIPAGPFLFRDDKRKNVIEKPFFIDIYPVTNEQFERFIKEGGYDNKDYWRVESWKWREENNISQPRYWNDPKWNKPGYPVVGVSFYEAEAFAKSLGKSLPTEEQWERAARGTDGREYPWGSTFDPKKCNTAESGKKGTTRVDLYPNGVSPDGCYDMAGNVWEWTKTEDGKGIYLLKGGSWFNIRDYARCAARDGLDPWYRLNSVGFRCVRKKK